VTDLLTATRSPWYATPVVAIAVLLGFNGLNSMIVWGSWVTTTIGLIACVTVAISITRMTSRSRTLPTVVGLIIALLASIPVFARGPEDQIRYLPTPTALRELAATVRDGIHEAAITVPPAEMSRPLLAVVMCGAFAIFIVAEHLAVSWRAAAFSGIILLVPWLPAIALQHQISVRLLLATIGCWVILLALTKRPSGVAARPSMVAAVTAAAATVALVALVTPTALGGNGWGLIPRLNAPSQLAGSSRLNLELNLRTSLSAKSSSVMMVYVSPGGRPDVFRQYTLTKFDGNEWDVDDTNGAEQPTDGVLWSNPVADWDSRTLDRVVVSVQDYLGDHLPLPTVPRTVDVPGSWSYSPSLDVVTSQSDSIQWLDYAFEADLHYFDADTLSSLGAASGDDAALGAEYVNIPEGADRDRFAALAAEVTAGATSRYDQAVALQEYFRDPSHFTYDTTVNPSGGDSVSVFLDSGSGYCVHFASGMIMLARSLGIPSRLAIGFLPGTPGADGSAIVHGGDAHAWPELYFAGAGWVRFEPTPAVQTGARPSYADPTDQETPVDGGSITVPEVNPTSAPRPDLGEIDTPPSQAPASGDSVPWAAIIALVIAVAALLGGAAWWMGRRRAHDDRVTTPETIWEHLGDRLPPEVTWQPPLTPRECVDHVVSALALEGATLPDDVIDQFVALSGDVADYRYAPEGTESDVAGLGQTADTIIAAIAAARGVDAKGRRVRADGRGDSRRDA